MTSGEGKVVCVTGASGYIASWLVKLLLQRGYTIKATVRDPNEWQPACCLVVNPDDILPNPNYDKILTDKDDSKKTEHLRTLDGAKERLHLFKADLQEEGSFDPVVDGCDGVFHTASPVVFTTNDPQADLIEPAVNGTLNVLKSCAKVASIKRVVLTSSLVSNLFNGKPLNHDVVVDESWFSDPAFCESKKLWYILSKTLAEEAAWKFAKENGTDMVTINPGFVIGPLLQPTINLTVELFLNGINQATIPDEIWLYVDVRDVANAHIRAFEIPSASGRYNVVGRIVYASEAVEILRHQYHTLSFPEKFEGDKPPKYEISQEKARSLGLNFLPLEVTLTDTIESLKEKGFIKL